MILLLFVIYYLLELLNNLIGKSALFIFTFSCASGWFILNLNLIDGLVCVAYSDSKASLFINGCTSPVDSHSYTVLPAPLTYLYITPP